MSDHNGIPVWKVEVPVVGLLSIQQPFSFNVRKEINYPDAFYSEVKISPRVYGFLVNLTAFAPTSFQAEQAGLVFLGRMLDVLSIKYDVALSVMSSSIDICNNDQLRVRRITDEKRIKDAFFEARCLTISENTYLRALGWFRKGKLTNEPLDRFLAFWNAIEVVACKYNPNKDVCENRGSICHIWESFKYVWGGCTEWPLIGGKEDWIDSNYEKRVMVAHGTIATDIESVSNISNSLHEIEKVSRKFLLDWREKLLVNVDSNLMN